MSPWYVEMVEMNNLEKKYGKERVIDTPTSESAITGLVVEHHYVRKPIVVHPRVDFVLYAMDPIVNHSKMEFYVWRMDSPGFTARMIINRGGEQGAQHSQALHSWFAHIPGLHVLMPSCASGGDMLIASTLSQNPVLILMIDGFMNIRVIRRY